jgi:hypothetical protein
MISRIIPLILASSVATAGGMALAQQASDAAKTPAPPSSTAASSADSADAEAAATAAAIAKATAAAAAVAAKAPAKITDEATIAKMAKKAGYHTEVQNGATLYCIQTVGVGTRFSSKKCATPTQLAVVLEQMQAEKDQLSGHGCGNCGGSK